MSYIMQNVEHDNDWLPVYKLLNQKSHFGKDLSTKLTVTIVLKCIFNLVLHHTSYLPGKSILTLFISLPGETE